MQESKSENSNQHVSADSLIGPADYDVFRPGRSQSDVLYDLEWRGNFEFAATYQGRDYSAISYGILGGPYSDHGDSVLAIFVDDQFEKCVRQPVRDATLVIGDFRILIRAIESDSIDLVKFAAELQSRATPQRQTNAALTAAWLLAREAITARRAPELQRNVELRDQFNAARLKLRMTEAEVTSVLKATPIESGEVPAGEYRLYGSTEALDITVDLHYANILILLKDDSVIGIYSGALVPGGDGRQQMRKWFIELDPT